MIVFGCKGYDMATIKKFLKRRRRSISCRAIHHLDSLNEVAVNVNLTKKNSYIGEHDQGWYSLGRCKGGLVELHRYGEQT